MPLLPREPELFPAHLFDSATAPGDDGRAWWVLHTKPRQEKSLARTLLGAEVPFYLPQTTRRWRLRGRLVASQLPLFAGYLFLLADREQRLTALATRRVVRALEVPDQQGLWSDLRQLHRLIASGAPVMPEDRLYPGATVEVRSGPLAGLRGKILRTASSKRFVVQIDFIQKGASVLLDDVSLMAVTE